MNEAASERRGRRLSLIVRAIYALCLAGATFNHATGIAQHGLFWDHGGLPKASAVFWTTLVVLDPAAVILLFVRPNAGIAATAIIIVVDVAHNLWIEAHYFPPLIQALRGAPQLMEQIAFMIFVLVTAPFAWRRGATQEDKPAA